MKGQKKGFKHTEETKKIISDHSKKHWKDLEYIKKVREGRKRTIDKMGYVNSPKTRKKLSNIMKQKIKNKEFNPLDISPYIKGHKKGMLGKKQSEEAKRKIGEKNKIHRKYQIFPKKDTKIEKKIQKFLKVLGVEFFTHQYMKIEHGYQCDILIPSINLVIECDGDYWHKYPIGLEKDHIRTKELIDKGFKILRLWERDIKIMELNDFKKRLKI